jgi:hypothetical protein
MAPFASATDEAYRQYALGVAYEALGYGADTTEETLKYLEQAASHYNNAIDANPKEAYFTRSYESIIFRGKNAEAPLTRVQAALVQYQKQQEYAAKATSAEGGSVAGGKGGDFAAGEAAMTNASVIEMLGAGLPDEVIITSVDAAKSRALDVSPKGLIQLSQAKASKKLIQHLQAASNTTVSSQQTARKSAVKTSSTKQ